MFKVVRDSFNWTSCSLVSNRKCCFTWVASCFVGGKLSIWSFWDDWKWKSSYPTTDRPSIFFFFCISREKRRGQRREGGDGLLKSRVHLSHSFFIYSPCLFFFSLLISNTPPRISSPIFNTLSLCPLWISRPPTSSFSLFSSPLPPKGKEILPAAR